MSGPFRNKLHVQEYIYDFSVDGGATGTLTLSNKTGYDPLPIGAIVCNAKMWVSTACTSGGSATVDVGNGDDDNGYLTAIAVASLTANSVHSSQVEAGALLWDDTNDAELYYYVDDATTGATVFKINTAALTAGKCLVMVDYYFPSYA